MAISYSTATPATPNRRAAGVKKAMGVGSELREDPAWIGAEEQARRRKLLPDQRVPSEWVRAVCTVITGSLGRTAAQRIGRAMLRGSYLE
jgi:hypothetical protein